MSYLEQFLEKYFDHIECYEDLLYVLSLLPNSYQYVFAKNLIKYSGWLVDGDLFSGVRVEGVIKVVGDEIILVHDGLSGNHVVLLELPGSYDL